MQQMRSSGQLQLPRIWPARNRLVQRLRLLHKAHAAEQPYHNALREAQGALAGRINQLRRAFLPQMAY